jgi:AmmeMemoRadiSam system protein A
VRFVFTEDEARELLRHTRQVLMSHFGLGLGLGLEVDSPDASPIPKPTPTELRKFQTEGDDIGGVFVTLRTDGELRGCIGYVHTITDLSATLRRAAIAAATSDPRFPSVTAEEALRVRISISVLTQPEVVHAPEEHEWFLGGRDGLIVERERDGARGLLLPQVALEHRFGREAFLDATCRKAGLPAGSWRDTGTIVKRFETMHVEEDG